jgi:hypothetical protein
MKDYLKRREEMSIGLVPPEGTKEYEKMKEEHEKRMAGDPEFQKQIDKMWEKALRTVQVQSATGLGYGVDKELRYYLQEFNHRSWKYGHRSMPVMFNVMEAFYDLDKSTNSWKLLDEENYDLSFFDFLDFYTSNSFEINSESASESFVEDLIYNYCVTSEISELTFKTDTGKEFVIAGISLVRRGNEVSILFQCGEVINTKVASEKLDRIVGRKTPGKEKIVAAPEWKREAVQLNGNENLWKTLVVCRFDLASKTIEARYVARDDGSHYKITTDDITGFMRDGVWTSEDAKAAFDQQIKDIGQYDSIFELAKAVLNIPEYFNSKEDALKEREVVTEAKQLLSNPLQRNKFSSVESKYKIRTRTVWFLESDLRSTSDRVTLKDENYKLEIKGYWKKLEQGEVGTDKEGNPVQEKTWVVLTESYYQAPLKELIVDFNSGGEIFTGPNAGYIYVMRNATMEKNIFKVGLTRNPTDERASQLSKTSVPDKFYVMREWYTKDCVLAEAEIHNALNKFRIDPRREFFQVEMKVINDTVDRIIAEVNSK